MLAREAEEGRTFVGEPDNMRVTFRLRKIDGAVILRQGFGEVASYLRCLGLEQRMRVAGSYADYWLHIDATWQGSSRSVLRCSAAWACAPFNAMAATKPR